MKIYRIVWRELKTGNVKETAGVEYKTWEDADAALSTLLGFRRYLTPTIESEAR